MPAIATLCGFGGTRTLRTAGVAAIALAAALTPCRATDYGTLAPFIGMPSAPVRAVALDGSPIMIGAAPDRVTLVHFFASWCEPCEDELPSLAAYVKARPERIRFIGVNVAEPASRAKKFVARFDLPGATVLDEDKAVTRAFHVRGLPATVALAPGGARALAAAGPLDWRSPEIGEALDGLAAKQETLRGEQR